MDHRRLVVVFTFLVIFSFDLARTTDIDFWWHLKTGELIFQTGSVPRADSFSHTVPGRPWVAHEWLWELGSYVIYRFISYWALVLISAAIVTGAHLCLYRLMRRLGANELLSAALTLWAAILALPNLGVRPREVTFLFLAIYLSQLMLYRERQNVAFWPLPLVMVLWVNLHGAFALGLILIGIVLVGELFDWRFQTDPPVPFPRRLLVIAGLTVVAACFNPRGPLLLFYPFNYFIEHENPSFTAVSEFQSPNFHEPMMMLFAAGLALFLVMGGRRGRFSIVDALLLGAFTVQALLSVRQVSVWALVAAPLLAQRLCERFSFARSRPPVRLPPQFQIANWLILVGLLIAGGVYAFTPRVQKGLQLRAEPTTDSLPVAGAQFVEERNLPGSIFNYQAWGGYLIYRWYPERPVFVDGRVDMYGPDLVREYLEVMTLKPNWLEVFDRYGVRTVLIEKGSALASLLSVDRRWEQVFEGEVEVIFVRRGEEPTAPKVPAPVSGRGPITRIGPAKA